MLFSLVMVNYLDLVWDTLFTIDSKLLGVCVGYSFSLLMVNYLELVWNTFFTINGKLLGVSVAYFFHY